MADLDLKFIVAGALLIALMLAKFFSGNRPGVRPRLRARRPRSTDRTIRGALLQMPAPRARDRRHRGQYL